nr:hypothetical protein [Propionicimonas sp.]
MEAFYNNRLDPALPDATSAMLRKKLEELVKLAHQGRVSFTGPQPHASTLDRSDGCYELRPKVDSRIQPQPLRELRLYLAEPKVEDGVILGLHLATKPNDVDVLGEQDAAIDEADRRADDWEIKRMFGKSA